MGQFFVLALASFFAAQLWADCDPSSKERQFAEAVSTLYTKPLWASFPTRMRLAVSHVDAFSPGYYIARDADEAEQIASAGLGKLCPNHLVQMEPRDVPTLNHFYPVCPNEREPDACDVEPNLKKFYRQFALPIGLWRMDNDRVDRVLRLLFGEFGPRWSLIQASVDHNFHEMFHGYQDQIDLHRKSLRLIADLPVSLDHVKCLELPDWSAQYQTERDWWRGKVAIVYDLSTSRSQLIRLAREFVNRVRVPQRHACYGYLHHQELIEGVAHFIGNKAMLETGVIERREMTEVDLRILDVPPSIHTNAYYYITGGVQAMLLERLYGETWHAQADEGYAPFEILTQRLSRD